MKTILIASMVLMVGCHTATKTEDPPSVDDGSGMLASVGIEAKPSPKPMPRPMPRPVISVIENASDGTNDGQGAEIEDESEVIVEPPPPPIVEYEHIVYWWHLACRAASVLGREVPGADAEIANELASQLGKAVDAWRARNENE